MTLNVGEDAIDKSLNGLIKESECCSKLTKNWTLEFQKKCCAKNSRKNI